MPRIFLTLLFIIQVLKGIHSIADGTGNDCFIYLIGDTPKHYQCGVPGLFSASSLKLPNPSQELTVSLTIIPTNLCSTTTDINFLTVSILPSHPGGVRKRVMMIAYLPGTSQIAWLSEDQTGTIATAHIISISAFWDKPSNFFISVSMVPGTNYLTIGGVYDNGVTIAQSTAASYHSSWMFDSTIELSVCSDYGGVNSIGCTVQNLKVKYAAYASAFSVMTFSNTVTMLGDYKLNDGSGKKLKNSQGALDSAALSSPPPTWSLDGGVAFTASDQYIELPNFIPSAADLTIVTSVAFTFYIKIDTAPSTTSNVMSYYCASISGVIFSVKITPNGQFTISIDSLTSPETTTFTLGTWTMVYVSYTFSFGGFAATNLYINGIKGADTFGSTSHGSSVFSSSDRVRFGEGFLGRLQRIQVYSPAAWRLNPEPCGSTTCALDIGFSIPPTCLQAVCTTVGTYTSFGSCESCPKGCSACTDPKTCQSCSSDYYSNGGTCSKCPQGQYINSPTSCANCPSRCSSCTDPQTCQSCNSGYGLMNNFCVVCPSGTYLNNNRRCQEPSPALQETIEKTQLITSGATQASSVASRGGSLSLSAAVSGRIFSQIKYLNISYSGELQVALKTWLPSFVSLGLTPDMPEGMIDKIPNHYVPYVFEKYEVPSSFLRNFWESLGIVVFAAVLWMLFHGIELILNPQRRPKLASFIRKTRIAIQNFLFIALYGVYGDLVMFSIVEYRTFVFGWNLTLLSFIVSIIMLIAMFLSFWHQTKLLINYQKLKKQDQQASSNNNALERFMKKHEGSQVIFKDFKDYSIAPQLFLFFLSGRDLLCSLILATMFEYPLPQTIIMIILDCSMITYLFIKRPFRSSFEFAQQLFFEFTGIVVNVSVFVNAILDAGKYEAFGTRNNIGKLVIIANIIFNFVTAVFMLISLGLALLEFYREQKQKRVRIFKTLSLRNRPHETQNKPRLDSNQSFLNDSSIIRNAISIQPESSGLNLLPQSKSSGLNSLPKPESSGHNLLPQQTFSSKRNKIRRRNPSEINESRHISLSPQKPEIPDNSAHLQIESNNYKYNFPNQQRRLNENNDLLRSSITYNPTEKLSKNH